MSDGTQTHNTHIHTLVYIVAARRFVTYSLPSILCTQDGPDKTGGTDQTIQTRQPSTRPSTHYRATGPDSGDSVHKVRLYAAACCCRLYAPTDRWVYHGSPPHMHAVQPNGQRSFSRPNTSFRPQYCISYICKFTFSPFAARSDTT